MLEVKKTFIVNDDTRVDLTFNELLDMYKPLITSEIIRFDGLRMEYDDRYQIATLALWRAYDTYDLINGTCIGSLAKKTIRNAFLGVIDYENKPKRSGRIVISMYGNNGNNDYSMLDFIPSTEKVEDNLITQNIMTDFMSKINKKQKQILKLRSEGVEWKQIEAMLGVGQSTISMRMSYAKKTFMQCCSM